MAAFVFSNMGYGVGMVFSIALVMIMPAVIILIAIDEWLLTALNPARFIKVISATATSYFVMVLFIIVMLFSIEVLNSTFGRTNYQSLSIFLNTLIFSYYNVVMFHIMGHLVYQNRIELGYRVSTNDRESSVKARTSNQRRAAQLELLVKAGRYEAARQVAAQIVKQDT